MTKSIAVIISVLILILGCRPKQSRIDIIKSAIVALEKNDTASIFSLMEDTAFGFKVAGKENIVYYIQYCHDHNKMCNNSSNVVISGPVYLNQRLIEYSVPFCRGENGSITPQSFEIKFLFQTFENGLYTIDLKPNSIDMSNIKSLR
jgi:hypothetical protein